MSKNFDERVYLQSEKREERIREVIGERLHGIAEGRTPETPFPKGKGTEQSVQISRSQGEESQDEPEPPLGERERGDSGNMERKGWTSQ